MQTPASSFVFLRHGETDWNRLGLCVGQADRALTEHGRAQAERAAAAMSAYNPTAVVCSPLSRARETAEIVAAQLGQTVIIAPGLIEACLGETEGRSEYDPQDDFIRRWLSGGWIRGAEPYAAFERRISATFADLIRRHGACPLLVSHWAVYRALSTSLGMGDADIEHCHPRYHRFIANTWRAACSAGADDRS